MKCGTLFCFGGDEYPITGQKAFYNMQGGGTCNIAVDQDKIRSLDMVPTGTKCGVNEVRLFMNSKSPLRRAYMNSWTRIHGVHMRGQMKWTILCFHRFAMITNAKMSKSMVKRRTVHPNATTMGWVHWLSISSRLYNLARIVWTQSHPVWSHPFDDLCDPTLLLGVQQQGTVPLWPRMGSTLLWRQVFRLASRYASFTLLFIFMNNHACHILMIGYVVHCRPVWGGSWYLSSDSCVAAAHFPGCRTDVLQEKQERNLHLQKVSFFFTNIHIFKTNC